VEAFEGVFERMVGTGYFGGYGWWILVVDWVLVSLVLHHKLIF
jgi:hypothetical protein